MLALALRIWFRQRNSILFLLGKVNFGQTFQFNSLYRTLAAPEFTTEFRNNYYER